MTNDLSVPIETIVEIGGEGGSITLEGRRDVAGGWQFRLATNESAMWDMLGEEPPPHEEPQWVSTWADALALLDRYPWPLLEPVAVHPEFKAALFATVASHKRSGPQEVERWKRFLDNAPGDSGRRHERRPPSLKKIYVQSQGIDSWQALVAAPHHWKPGRSAMELATSWELAAQTGRGLPPKVADVLDMHASTRGATLIFGAPEHRVDLPGGSRPSQTDLWAVVKVDDGWASIAVEGKATEAFGPTVEEWLKDASDGKATRLRAIRETLGLTSDPAGTLRYQLFHRSASAVMEAERIGASTAVVLVQHFHKPAGSPAEESDAEQKNWQDFESFVQLFDVAAIRGGVCQAKGPEDPSLLFAWVDCPVATDAGSASVVH